jgi:Domain of unknown function (DUF222)
VAHDQDAADFEEHPVHGQGHGPGSGSAGAPESGPEHGPEHGRSAGEGSCPDDQLLDAGPAEGGLQWSFDFDLEAVLSAIGRPVDTGGADDQEEILAAELESLDRDDVGQSDGGGPGGPGGSGGDLAGLVAESLPAGPGLAAWLSQRDAGDLSDRDLPGVAAAFRRLASWAQAGELAAVAEIAVRSAARDDKTGLTEDGRPAGVTRDAAAQVSLGLTLSPVGAAWWADLAVTLGWRLRGTGAALAGGHVDLYRARIIADATACLPDEAAQVVEGKVLPGAGDLAYGQLRAVVRRAVIAADPEGAEQRRQDAERRARVSLYPDDDLTATLTGSRLPAIQAAAAMARITAMARALKAAGFGGGLDLLRARVFLGLLLGTLQLIPPPADGPPDNDPPDDDPPDDADPRDGDPPADPPPDDGEPPDDPSPHDADGLRRRGTAGPAAGPPHRNGPGPAGPRPGRPDPARPDRATAAAQGNEGVPPDASNPAPPSTPSTDPPDASPPDASPPDASPPDPGSADLWCTDPWCTDPWPDVPPHTDADAPADDGFRDTASPLPDGYADDGGDRGDPLDFRDLAVEPAWPAVPPAVPVARGSAAPAAETGRPPPGGLLDLTVSWATLTGEARPATLGRIGPVTAPQARHLARLSTGGDYDAQWRVIVTDAGGRATAVARVPRARRTGNPAPQPAGQLAGAGLVGLVGLVGRVTVTIPQAVISDTRPWPATARGILAGILRTARRADDLARRQARADRDTAGGCAHAAASPAYRPPPRIREHVIARDRTCRYPYCGQPAWRGDLDHTCPWEQGGRTCRCNLGPLCRSHHRLKQLDGWTLAQPHPGTFCWTTPAGRTYTTQPDPQPA